MSEKISTRKMLDVANSCHNAGINQVLPVPAANTGVQQCCTWLLQLQQQQQLLLLLQLLLLQLLLIAGPQAPRVTALLTC